VAIKAWLSVAVAVGAALFADEGPRIAPSRCQWVTGPACTLGAEVQSVCTMTASCPSGTKVVSGACEGFTSVAIGRSAPDAEETAWGCAASRVSRIQNPNQIAARALCCP
jgi:hypothetical protein